MYRSCNSMCILGILHWKWPEAKSILHLAPNEKWCVIVFICCLFWLWVHRVTVKNECEKALVIYWKPSSSSLNNTCFSSPHFFLMSSYFIFIVNEATKTLESHLELPKAVQFSVSNIMNKLNNLLKWKGNEWTRGAYLMRKFPFR